MKDATLSIEGQTILKDFNILVQPNERIGISGENGAGKTSLLNVIAGRLKLDSGIIKIGETVKMAYYTQLTEPIPEDKRVISYLSEIGQQVTDKDGQKNQCRRPIRAIPISPIYAWNFDSEALWW